ncbi:MAG TPA: helix-turn-helix domain-containing protein [Solirubrobacterales bacterium]|nr:helix-turn-helix domain-containing protein [Solirubrobacterales bacterium]
MTPERPKLLRQVIEVLAGEPERLMLAAALAEGPASAAELAEGAGISPDRVRRHLRKMKEEGLIESVRTETHRGAVEHFYVASGEMLIDAEELAELDFAERRAINGYILKLSLSEAIAALVRDPSGRSLERLDGVLVRNPMTVDREGWEELVAIHEEAYARITEAKKRIAARLEAGAEVECRASSLIMVFESEPPRSISAGRPGVRLLRSDERDQDHVDHQRRGPAQVAASRRPHPGGDDPVDPALDGLGGDRVPGT